MGVDGLWPELAGSSVEVSVDDGSLDGRSIGIDISVLMHGAMSDVGCAKKQVLLGEKVPYDAVARVADACACN